MGRINTAYGMALLRSGKAVLCGFTTRPGHQYAERLHAVIQRQGRPETDEFPLTYEQAQNIKKYKQ